VRVPPLRERRPDVPLLIDHFAGRYRRLRDLAFEPQVIDALVAYDWPGNIRQLGRVIERALALSPGPTVTIHDLPRDIAAPLGAGEDEPVDEDQTLRGYSSRYARVVLDRCNGNKARACRILDITYHTLQAHLDYGVSCEHAP